MTGHIRQRSPGSYELRYRAGSKTVTATFRGGKREAERELRRLLVAVDSGAVAQTKMTTGAWLDAWLAIVKPEVAAATLDHYRRAVVTHIRPRLGTIPLAKLSRADVQQMFSELAEGGRADGKAGPLAPGSRKQIHAVLSIALNRASDLQMVNSNVAQVMRRRMPRGDAAPETAVLSPEQSTVLLNASRGSALFAPILLSMSTGCRRGEASGLTWGNIDLDGGAVTFTRAAKQIGSTLTFGRTKSGKPRVVTLGANAIEELRAWRLDQAQQLFRLGVRQTAETPVCTRADGSLVAPNAITTDFWRLARRLGLGVHYHSLRHGHATALLLAGVHPKVAQERLGHHSVAFTLDRYSHTIERLHDDAAAKIDGIFRAPVAKL